MFTFSVITEHILNPSPQDNQLAACAETRNARSLSIIICL